MSACGDPEAALRCVPPQLTSPLGEASAWVEKQRREWNPRLDALEDHLEAMQKYVLKNHHSQEAEQ